MDYQIRKIRENEYPILSDFLYGKADACCSKEITND